ncbi:hypothetical protein ABT052_28825 [Streptomyces sp. NPDC002766]|uniref:hypothetical protein n=1 Tax=Streptomyces sp. NPDC002766 TaxID=3154429 RepID=UPI003325BD72
MTWWQATLWGLAGGGAAALLSFSTAVKSAGYLWPWRGRKKKELWPRLFVLAVQSMLGAAVAAAAHDQISGPWPAFIFGVGAPATIRGLLSGVEVAPRSLIRPTPQTLSDVAQVSPATSEEDVREDAP